MFKCKEVLIMSKTLYLISSHIWGKPDRLYTYNELIKALNNYSMRDMLPNALRWYEIRKEYKYADYFDDYFGDDFYFMDISKVTNVKSVQRKITQYNGYQSINYIFNPDAKSEKITVKEATDLNSEANAYRDKMKNLRSDWNYLVQTNALGRQFPVNKPDIIINRQCSTHHWNTRPKSHTTQGYHHYGAGKHTTAASYRANKLFKEQGRVITLTLNNNQYKVCYRHLSRHVDLTDHPWEMDGIRAKRSAGWKNSKIKHQWMKNLNQKSDSF